MCVINRFNVALARVFALGACIGLALPAAAYINLSGTWDNAVVMNEDAPERIPGPEIGDYLGIPINEANRMRADTWDAELLTLPDYQCRVHPSDYVPSFGAIRIWEEIDPQTQKLVAIHTRHFAWGTERTIWMDDRPHPPSYALHTAMGFSTGKWQGNALVITTTHLKEGWIRRNGVVRSDRATVTEHFLRHDDHLNVLAYIDDPLYLTEPFVRSRDYLYQAGQQIGPYPCESAIEVVRPKGLVPHHLPGSNTFLGEFASAHGVPLAAARGGAATMYPEYPRMPAVVAAATQLLGAKDVGEVGQVQVLPVQGSVYMMVSRGGNVTAQVGAEGTLIVDTLSAQAAPMVLGALQKLAPGTLRYIVSTSFGPDRTGGNDQLRKAGRTIVGGNVNAAEVAGGAKIVANENVLVRMSAPTGVQPASPVGDWPTDAFPGDEKKIYFNGEGIEVIHVANAHTDGDSIVYFRRSDVISTGNVFVTTGYPVIDLESGGTIQGEIDALNRIADLIVPSYGQEGGTLVVPGRGRLCDLGDVLNYRDMVTIIRDRIVDLKAKGVSLEKVLAARPTRDYDPLYGSDSGDWTTANFVEAIYRSLGDVRGFKRLR
jgi:glyoxylase-like metal-dependent hydrolase (beta-lactamase superfamily II)